VPVTFADLSAEAGADYVELRGTIFLDAPTRLFVLRSADTTGPFETIGEVAGESGRSQFRYRDAAVLPSTAYTYKIGALADGLWTYSTPIHVTLPAGVFAFRSVGSNPGRGPRTLSFELDRSAYARLALYNVAGRRVRQVVDQLFAAGIHVVQWDGQGERGESLAAGVYVLRLESENRKRSVRLVITR